jgi:hypothetical protein
MNDKILLDTIKDAFWLNYKRAKWSNNLLKSLKKKVIDWWTFKSTIFPNRKDVTKPKCVLVHFGLH